MKKTGIVGAGVFAVGLAFAALAAFAADDPGHAGHAAHGDVVDVPVARPPEPDPHAGHGAPTKAPPPPPTKAPPPTSVTSKEEPRVPIDVLPEQQRRIGVETTKATKQPVTHTIKVVGSVVPDERREAHVHTRVAGFLEEVPVSAVGTPVKKGQVLYRMFSPELSSTQEEIVAARAQGDLGRRLIAAGLERLARLDVAPSEIEALRNGGPAKRALAFLSPADGVVVDKMAVKGMYVTPDMDLYRIADLSRVWIVASLYEGDLPLVAVGDDADVSLTADPGNHTRLPVSYVYPELDVATRTGRARVEVDNKDGRWKPGMFVDVAIVKDLGVAVVVPEDAVVFTGARNLVFKKTGAARFQPVEVKVGPRVDAGRVVLSGVDAGDDVVVRATFLIDAESRLQAALQKGAATAGHAGHGG